MTGKLLLCGAFALAIAILALSPAGRWLEREVGLSALYSIRGPLEPPDGALVIGLDRASVGWLQRNARAIGRVAPSLEPCLSQRARDAISEARNVNHIPRGLYACLIRELASLGPSLIVVDVNFNVEKPEDELLASAIRDAGNVVLFEKVNPAPLRSWADSASLTVRLHPAKILRKAALSTAGFHVNGRQGDVTTGYLRRFPAFPDLRPIPEVAWAYREGRSLPAGEGSNAFQLIWLYGPAGTVPTRFLRDVFDPGSGRPLAPTLQGEVVFIGASDPAHATTDDHFRIPGFGGGGSLIGGVELGATAYLNLLHGTPLSAPSIAAAGAIMLVLGAVLAAAALLLPGPYEIAAIVGVTLLYAILAAVGFSEARLWLPVAVPVAIAAPAACLLALENRYRLASALVGRLAPRQIARRLLAASGSQHRHTEIEQATVMFTDVAGSTSLGEAMSEAEFTKLMSDYYDLATSAIEAHRGMVVDYRGDGVLAVFTESVSGRDHAAEACRAAIEICAGSRELGAAEPDSVVGRLRLRVGLNTGQVATGTVGARGRFNYNALGDSVNVASRLEQLGKEFGGDGRDIIIASETTRDRAGLADVRFERLGEVQLRGRRTRTAIYRVSETNQPA